ncbi:MAG: hypothetical protein B7Z15_18470 [Rhizobiales bacterium 32-66-8]|nr:MAG: hypothetical protein B7Z15_18470 [Rhizobiales bacterium 32-66-8]
MSTTTIDGEAVQTVNARELHASLEVATPFNDWIARRLAEYGFVAGRDFHAELRKTSGRPTTDYHLTLDMAKELAMVERNDAGRRVRLYFIECERRAKAKAAPPRFQGGRHSGILLTHLRRAKGEWYHHRL